MDPLKIGVAVIESLGNEKKTGKELYETTLKYISFEKNFVENEYFEVNNSEELYDVLKEIYNKAKTQNKFYFLHFEVHGKEGGIELKNGEIVSWEEILPYLRELNILYRNHLAVYMAVCKGNSLIKFIHYSERAPFALLMGSFFDIKTGDIMEAFEVFYREFFKVLSPLDAYNAIKKLDISSDFTILTSQHIVDKFLELQREDEQGLLLFQELHKELQLAESTFGAPVIEARIRIGESYNAYKVNTDFFLIRDL